MAVTSARKLVPELYCPYRMSNEDPEARSSHSLEANLSHNFFSSRTNGACMDKALTVAPIDFYKGSPILYVP
ncbi:hypothetical protein E4U23_004032 [Claviceps purpurea]|nr:hypothetical protein E4U23_004032 [Claviceps purpurea]